MFNARYFLIYYKVENFLSWLYVCTDYPNQMIDTCLYECMSAEDAINCSFGAAYIKYTQFKIFELNFKIEFQMSCKNHITYVQMNFT